MTAALVNADSPVWCLPRSATRAERIDAVQALARESSRDATVRKLAAVVSALAWDDSWTARVVAAMRVVQHQVPWVDQHPDQPDCLAWPAWVLVHGGDCDQRVCLLLAVLYAMGLPPDGGLAIWIEQEGAPVAHMTALVWTDRGWQWADVTVRGAELGEWPLTAAERTGDWRGQGA